jgi:hypothetical protein
LRLRALAGRVAAAGSISERWTVLAQLDPSTFDEQLAADLIAAAETTLEMAENATAPALASSLEPAALLAALSPNQALSPESRAMACVLTGRAWVLAGRWADALESFKISLSYRQQMGPSSQKWLDWRAPSNIGDRVALEFIRFAYPAYLSPAEVLEHVGQQVPEPDNLDSDRLGSAILLLQGAIQPVASSRLDSAILQSLRLFSGSQVAATPTHTSHRFM